MSLLKELIWRANHFEKRMIYWRQRCKAAEKYIEESPCDPDIHSRQIEAHKKWQEKKSKKEPK